MSNLSKKISYASKYWKLALHLVFKTKHFGVNNKWWHKHPSSLGWSWSRILISSMLILPIWRNYQSLKVRSCIGWIPEQECIDLGYKTARNKS